MPSPGATGSLARALPSLRSPSAPCSASGAETLASSADPGSVLLRESNAVDEISFDENGLAPCVVQDARTGEVLTLAYMNREALERTRASGETWFWSRSRGELWHKGETSGNTQAVRELRYDCDAD